MAALDFRVTPNAKRNELLGWETNPQGQRLLRVKLKAPPVEGKANQELIRFLSDVLAVPKSRLHLSKGQKNRLKRVEFEGLDAAEINQRIDTQLSK